MVLEQNYLMWGRSVEGTLKEAREDNGDPQGPDVAHRRRFGLGLQGCSVLSVLISKLVARSGVEKIDGHRVIAQSGSRCDSSFRLL